MRIWSLHPQYLDSKGLVALWREALLAKHVLEGKTKGYRNHPQIDRFKKAINPLDCINQYLTVVYSESVKRGFNFEREKIGSYSNSTILTVTRGQLDYERHHLLNKLKIRDKIKYNELLNISDIIPHPLFKVVKGDIEEWEKL
ncbi:MAG: pyrimidine dimer DNA glycosylase/endonuclease V [Bacteroidota bacterium]|nr:pyrimidine dimer DNA glycosylase/endonuclease V [Bacteroidota bacterium]